MRKRLPHIILILLIGWHTILFAQQRFPKPDFESGYVYPEYQQVSPRNVVWEYTDVLVLLITLSLASYFALKKRSRQGLIWTTVFSLAYFGFFREGCICAVGSVQNVSLALFNNGYTLPLTALLFFLIPLLFALAFGRVFCSSVCPLGAIQELTGIYPVKLPVKVETVLSTVPYVYLGLSVLFAATNSQFIICRYDPFVGIFRLDAPATMVVFGVLLLLAGMFINRPYCRFLCPYGVILNWFSRYSSKHLTITPAECINCKLCENSCPYNAIQPSNINVAVEDKNKARKRFILYSLLIPFLMVAGGFASHSVYQSLAGINQTVRLAREIRLETTEGLEAISQDAITFKESGKSIEELFIEELNIIERFRKGSPWLGIFLGLSLGITLMSTTINRDRKDYLPDKGKCYSCARCFEYCPVPTEK